MPTWHRLGTKPELLERVPFAVIEYYRDEILRTADLIGRDLSAWLR